MSSYIMRFLREIIGFSVDDIATSPASAVDHACMGIVVLRLWVYSVHI